MLDVERKFFEEHLADLRQRFEGRFVLIKDDRLMGDFDTPDAALREAARTFGLAPVLIRRVEAAPQEVSIPALTLGLLHADPPRSVQRNRNESAGPDSNTRS